MMLPINELQDVKKPSINKNRWGSYSNEIYSFDIETTSIFLINGKWQQFDKSISDYSDIDSRVCAYHCQFGVNDKVYYFYNIAGFEDVLKKLSNPFLTKTIWVYNLSYEFAFLIPILKKYTITNMIARQSHSPISFRIEELNIEFRCSLKLTGLSLAKASEQYTEVKKAKGDLDYNILRSPISARNMTEREKYYCEMDIICLYNIIKFYRNKYGSIYSIPKTQTGEMRRALKNIVPKSHFALIKKLVPPLEKYLILNQAFWGAVVHANRLHVNQYLSNIISIDESSSYPYVLATEKYPMSQFRKINKSNIINYDSENHAFIYTLKLSKIECRYYNTYIAYSKCRNVINAVVDNGRIACADYLEITCTDIDFDLIKKVYSFNVENMEVYVASKDYLPEYMLNFILDNYAMKTKLKGTDDIEMYMKAKQYNNSVYGACCTNYVKSSAIFDKDNLWVCPPLTDKIIQEKLDEQKERQHLFSYAWGLYCTAYARRNLFERIIECEVIKDGVKYSLDEDIVYYDTDSLKMMNFDIYKDYFDEYNNSCKQKMIEVCKARNLTIDKFFPKDIKGNAHPLGYFDFSDGDYTEFCTLGSKRYCYRDRKDNKLHISISGVNKVSGLKKIKDDIRNFNRNTFFGYDEAGKMLHTYIEGCEPYTFIDNEGNSYTDSWGYGVVLQPTTYSMTMDFNFEALINIVTEYSNRSKDYFDIRDKHPNTRYMKSYRRVKK